MAERSLLLKNSPILLGAGFNYPFVVNLISAIFIRLGVPFFAAFVVPSFIITWVSVALLFGLFSLWLKSQKQAILATMIFLFNGGTGIFWVMQQENKLVESTHISDLGIEWISVINSTLIPQRSFGLGFLVGLFCLILLFVSWQKNKNLRPQTIFLVSVLLGLLPIIHMHTFISLAVILACLVLVTLQKNPWQKNKDWILLGISTAIISLINIKIFYPDLLGSSNIRFQLGWMASENSLGIFEFWWRNWGVVPILAVFGLMLSYKKHPKIFPWLLGSLALFVLGNLFIFQAYVWDNTKLFAWASVGFSALTVMALEQFWQKKNLGKALAIFIFSFTIASGAYDAFYTLKFDAHSYQMYSKEEIDLSNWAKSSTDPNSIWLTSDQHNHWLYNLTGRQPIMGYQGWLWSHGYDFESTASDVGKMFSQPAESESLFKKYQIDYIVVGPGERAYFAAKNSDFEKLFEKIKSSENYDIFRAEFEH